MEAGWGNPNPPIWILVKKHLRLEVFCVCLEDDWSDLGQAVLNKPWTCPQGWKVFGRDSAKPSLCMFNLRLLITFEKCGKALIAQYVLRHSTKSLVEMLFSSPKGHQATIYISWDFFKSCPVMLFPVCLTGPWSLLLKSPTGCSCTTKCNRPVAAAWHEAKGMLWFIPTWLNSFTPKNRVATPSLPFGNGPKNVLFSALSWQVCIFCWLMIIHVKGPRNNIDKHGAVSEVVSRPCLIYWSRHSH